MLTLFLSLLFVAVSVGGLCAIMSRLEKEHQRATEGHTFGVIPFPEETTTPEKLSPRQLEQWWINNWLDKWFRLVGSKYEPREGDADYVAPKVEYIDVTKNENHNFQNPKMLTNGNTGWQLDQFGKVLSRDELIEKKPEPVYMEEQLKELETRRKLDPRHRLDDYAWSRLYNSLKLYEERMQRTTHPPQIKARGLCTGDYAARVTEEEYREELRKRLEVLYSLY